jgi:hypothetical protein
MQTFLTVLGYAWRILINIIQLVIVLVVFLNLKGRFEVIVVSTLGFIYLTLRTMGWGQAVMLINMSLGIDREFAHIRGLLGEEITEKQKAETEELTKRTKRQMAKSYVDLVFLSIIWIICLYQLFTGIGT